MEHMIAEIERLAHFDIRLSNSLESSIIALGQIWENALAPLANVFGLAPDSHDLPYALERLSSTQIRLSHNLPKVVGLAGPGAVGKNAFTKALAYKQLVNTTTRLPRTGEIDGVDYNFVSEREFLVRRSGGRFLTTEYREGRGFYGVETSSLDVALSQNGKQICIVQENPKNLLELFKSLHNRAESVLICLIPPFPMLPHLVIRLVERCRIDGTCLATTLESTLGERQVRELASLNSCIEQGTNTLIIVNDDLSRAVVKAKNVIEKGLAA